MDNAKELTSQTFNRYWISIGIVVEHPVSRAHTHNGLVESLIRFHNYYQVQCLQNQIININMVTYNTNAVPQIKIHRPITYHKLSPMQFISYWSWIIFSHLITFECVVYVALSPSQHIRMGIQRRMKIYVGF